MIEDTGWNRSAFYPLLPKPNSMQTAFPNLFPGQL